MNKIHTRDALKIAIGIMMLVMLLSGIGAAVTVPHEDWNKTYGKASYDYAWSVQQTADGGYIFAGESLSIVSGYPTAWLVKTDINGNENWNKTVGEHDGARSIRQTIDGGYILAGSSSYYVYTARLIKTDVNGNEQWNKTFGQSNSLANSVEQTSDGGYIITGYTKSFGADDWDAWLIKTDVNGNEQWNKTFGGYRQDIAYSGQQTSDGGFALAGFESSFSQFGIAKAWIIKTDVNGNEQWNKSIDTESSAQFNFIQQVSDGGYILAGYMSSYETHSNDVLLVKTDLSGNEQWNKTFGGIGSDMAYSVQQTADGGYVLVGLTGSYGAGGSDIWIIKTDSSGNEYWNETFGGTLEDVAYSVNQTIDSGYVVAGITHSFGGGSSDAWLIKVSSDADEIQVGEGAPDQAISDAFNDSYDNNGGINVLGKPTTVVHPDSSGYYIQEFPGVSGIPGGVIMYNPTVNEAFYLHGAIWERYEVFPDRSILGAVSQDETDAGMSPKGTIGRYSAFDNGRIHWIASSPTNSKVGQSFVTYGELDAKYTALGGTNHWLGFPVEDQKVFEGRYRQKFEGGYIYWNETSSAYEEATKMIAIIPVEFVDKTHEGGYSAENLRAKADQMVEYYQQQSYRKEKIGYKLYLNPDNPSVNEGWNRIPDRHEDIQASYKNGILIPIPAESTCANCDLPSEVRAEWYIFLAAMKEVGQSINQIQTGFYSPENYDVALMVFPWVADKSDVIWPVMHGRKKSGFIFVDNLPHSTWYHEMGHVYFGQWQGYIGNWGIMSYDGSALKINPPPPSIYFDREKMGWIKESNVITVPGKYSVKNINDDYLIENGVVKYGDDKKYYVFEGRYPPDSVKDLFGYSVTENGLKKEEGIEIYQVIPYPNDINKATGEMNYGIFPLDNKGDKNLVSLKPDESADLGYMTATALRESDGLKILVSEKNPFENDIIWKMMTVPLGSPWSQSSTARPRNISLDVDLHAVTADGRRIGMNYTTGEFINEINGANWSGNYMGGGEEWILVPSNESVRPYVVLSQDLKDILANDSNASVEVTSTLTVYDEAGNNTESTPMVLIVNSSNMDENLRLPIPETLPEIRYINGTVMDSFNKEGLASVTVSTNVGNSTYTNTTGFYSLNVAEGEFNLTAKLDPTYYMNNTLMISTVGKAMAEQNIELLMKPTGNITGSVTS